MLLNGNFLCRRICKTLSGVCKVPACKIFCVIPYYALNSCEGPCGAPATTLPAVQLSCSEPEQTNQLKRHLESALNFLTTSCNLLESNNYYFIFLLLGVSVVLVRLVMLGQLTVQPGFPTDH